MKINTKVVFEWNDESKQYEEVYSESYDYDGEIAESQVYGAGKSKLLATVGKEEAKERFQFQEEITAAEDARNIQSQRKGLLSMLGATVGGAIFGPAGIIGGTILGKWAGDVATVGGKQAEEYFVSEDVGQFGLSEKTEKQDVNIALRKADKADIYKDVVDVTTAAFTAYTMGGGKLTDPSNLSWTQFGGKGSIDPASKAFIKSDVGMGLFGTPEGKWGTGAGTLWGKWRT